MTPPPSGREPAQGLLLVHKPTGLTSHDVVEVVRRKLTLRRVGHTGTLDPMAEGLLILLVGAATRHQHEFRGYQKVYARVPRLGAQTDSADAAGRTIATAPVPVLDDARVAQVLASFEGECLQTPPAYSAVKVKGRPAYWWARRQQPVSLAPRPVKLSEVAFLGRDGDAIHFRVRCSAGTYVRTLAESVAERLGTVGHLGALIRLRIGAWDVTQAKSLPWIREAEPEALRRALLPVRSAPGGSGR